MWNLISHECHLRNKHNQNYNLPKNQPHTNHKSSFFKIIQTTTHSATRNDSLDAIVENCPEDRRKDLVFVQNGYLDNFLASKNLLDNTQVLLFVSVTSMEAEPIDGITTVNPEGLTTATGEHAEAFAGLLDGLGLKCNVVSSADYRPAMFEKLM